MVNDQLIQDIKNFINSKYGSALPSFPKIFHDELPNLEKISGLDNKSFVSALASLEAAGYIAMQYGNDELSLVTLNRSFPY